MSRATNRAARRAAKQTEPEIKAPVEEQATTPAEPKAKKTKLATKTWDENWVITILKPMVKGPATKSASAARYALYENDMTVKEYTDAVVKHLASLGKTGGKTFANGDLRWDVHRGHISITPKA